MTKEEWIEKYSYRTPPATLREAVERTLHQWIGLRAENLGPFEDCVSAKYTLDCPLCVWADYHHKGGCHDCLARNRTTQERCNHHPAYQSMVYEDNPEPVIDLLREWLEENPDDA